jgi:hypothetical protein
MTRATIITAHGFQGDRIWGRGLPAEVVWAVGASQARRRGVMEELAAAFAEFEDPRRGNAQRHLLWEVLMIALCAVLSGGERCADMALFGQLKESFLGHWPRRRWSLPSDRPRLGPWVLALKRNQGTLYGDVRAFLDDPATPLTVVSDTDGGHGRIEQRRSGVRHTVSSLIWSGCEPCCGGVPGGIVGCGVVPGFPDDAGPGSGEDSDGMLVLAAAASGFAVDGGGPWGSMSGVVGEAGEGAAEAVVAGPSEDDAAALAGGVGDRSDAGLGGELVLGREAVGMAELGQDLGGADTACAREGHDDPAVGQVGHGVLDAGGEPGDLGNEALEDGREGADQFALGLDVSGEAGGGGPEARQQFGRRAASALARIIHENGHIL